MTTADAKRRTLRQVKTELKSLLVLSIETLRSEGIIPPMEQSLSTGYVLEVESSSGEKVRFQSIAGSPMRTAPAVQPLPVATPSTKKPIASQVARVEKTSARKLGITVEDIEAMARDNGFSDWRSSKEVTSRFITFLDEQIQQKG